MVNNTKKEIYLDRNTENGTGLRIAKTAHLRNILGNFAQN